MPLPKMKRYFEGLGRLDERSQTCAVSEAAFDVGRLSRGFEYPSFFHGEAFEMNRSSSCEQFNMLKTKGKKSSVISTKPLFVGHWLQGK